MAEHVILVAGPMGAGKTTAIRAVSDIAVVSTEAENTDRTAFDKDTTTVAMDYGEIGVSDEEKIRLYGLPGQRRFEFMWRILVDRALGMVLLIDNSSPDPLGDVAEYLEAFDTLLARGSAVIGITRGEAAGPSIAEHAAAVSLRYPGRVLPVLPLDPRESSQVRLALMTLIATIEMESTFVTERSPA